MGNSENPGQINAGILEYIQEEYDRVRKNQNALYLTLSQVLEIHPHQDYPFQFQHLGILFVCDKQLDGVFTFEDFKHFASWIQINFASVQMYEFKSQLQARTVSKIIDAIDKKNGENQIVSWFIKMLTADKRQKKIQGQTYIKIECIKLIYEILNVKMMTDMDIQSFFYLIKKSSEDLGFPIQQYKGKQEEEEDQYIHIVVCKELISHFIKGAAKILKQIGYRNTLL